MSSVRQRQALQGLRQVGQRFLQPALSQLALLATRHSVKTKSQSTSVAFPCLVLTASTPFTAASPGSSQAQDMGTYFHFFPYSLTPCYPHSGLGHTFLHWGHWEGWSGTKHSYRQSPPCLPINLHARRALLYRLLHSYAADLSYFIYPCNFYLRCSR